MTAPQWLVFKGRDHDAHDRVARANASLRTRTEMADLPVDHPDRATVDRIRAGDREAFDTLYRAVYPTLHRFAQSWGHPADVADDVVQDVFVTLWLRRTTWSVRTSAIAYLMGAVRNALRFKLRSESMAARTVDLWHALELIPAMGQPPQAPDTTAEARDVADAIAHAVSTLPPRQRMAILLYWQDGLTSGEIADVMEISDRVARKFLARAMETLQPLLDAHLTQGDDRTSSP